MFLPAETMPDGAAGVSPSPGRPETDRRTHGPGRGADRQARGGDARPHSPGGPALQGAARTGGPKTLGHKYGNPHGDRAGPPGSVTECHRAPPPDARPNCHGPLVGTGSAEQFCAEIPRQPLVRKFVVHSGRSAGRGAPAHEWHSLMTCHTLRAAAGQTRPDARAAVALPHVRAGLSCGKPARVYSALYGITQTRGAGARIAALGHRGGRGCCAPAPADRVAHRGDPPARAVGRSWGTGGAGLQAETSTK